MQENNKQLASHLKEKHQQVLSLRDSNRSLKQVNMETGLEEKATLKTELEEMREALGRRDTEVCSFIYPTGKFSLQNSEQVKELLHRQDILEKSHKQQLIAEMKKKKEVKRQLVAAEERIKTLEGTVLEKDKQINRLYIYSRRQGERGAPTIRSSVSTGNLSSSEAPRPATSHHYPGPNQVCIPLI